MRSEKPGSAGGGEASGGSVWSTRSAARGPRSAASQFRSELVECSLAKVNRFSFREQQILSHEIVNETRHGLARGANHVRNRLMGRPSHRDVTVVQRLSALLRE